MNLTGWVFFFFFKEKRGYNLDWKWKGDDLGGVVRINIVKYNVEISQRINNIYIFLRGI